MPSLKALLEALLFASETPLKASDLFKLLAETPEASFHLNPQLSADESQDPKEWLLAQTASENTSQEARFSKAAILEALQELKIDYLTQAERGIELVEVAHGFQFRTKVELASYVRRLQKDPTPRFSQAALESLSIIAYQQPITRSEIDQLRGVDSGGVVRTLLERQLIKIVGKKDEAGKPLLYGTTDFFLETFQLQNLHDLPTLKDLKQIEEELQQQKMPENNVSLGDDFFEESTEPQPARAAALFQEIESEEEQTFDELDQKLASLKDIEQAVLAAITPQPQIQESSEENLLVIPPANLNSVSSSALAEEA